VSIERNQGIEYCSVWAKDDRSQVPLVGIGDLHYGVRTFNKTIFDRVLRWVKENKAYWIGMGDYVEMATKASPGAGVFEQAQDANEQLDQIVKFFAPIAGNCLGLLRGNHEHRLARFTGLDPVSIIARELGVPALGWEGYGGVTKANACAYTWYACHSYTGNKTAGLALNWTEREVMKWVDADILFRAHSHDMGFDPKLCVKVDSQKRTVQSRPRTLVMTGHYMDRKESYIASRAASPKSPGTVGLWLHMATNPSYRKITPEYLM
jgi:hypothetical protein